MGERDLEVIPQPGRVAVETFAGRIHVEWDPDAAVTPMGQLPFFIEFLKVSGLFDALVADCPLRYCSPNAPEVRDVLGTLLLSSLAGHKRYAHMTNIRSDRVNPELLGMTAVMSEDSVRRGLGSFDETLTIAQHYRDRGDSENCFDELKNHWGWGGFTTQDLKRCRISSRFIALVYNWWSLFVRLVNPDKHHEAITSRPLMLQAVAKQTSHAGQTTVTITSSHAKAHLVQAAMRELTGFFKQLAKTAEQLGLKERIKLIARHAYRKLLALAPPLPTPKWLPAPG